MLATETRVQFNIEDFKKFLVTEPIESSVRESVVKDVDNFLATKAGNNIDPYDLENYLRKLAEEKFEVSHLKSVSKSLQILYKYLNITIPADSSLTHSLLLSETKEGVVEIAREAALETGFLHVYLLPLIMSIIGWFGIVAKLKVLSLLLLGVSGIASTSYVVKHPTLIPEAASSVKKIATESANLASKTVLNTNIFVTDTSPQLDARYTDIHDKLSSLSTMLTSLQSKINSINTRVTNITDETENFNTDTITQHTTSTVYTGSTEGLDALAVRVSDLEEYVNNGFNISKFKVIDDNGNVLSYVTSNGTDLNIDSNANVSGSVVVENNLEVNGILSVKSDGNEPEEAPEGGLYFNTDNNQLYVADGENWNQVGKTYAASTSGGLQLVNDQFGLINCSENEVLKYVGGTWACSSINASNQFTFTSLSDAPTSYSGMGSRLIRVGVGESSLEFLDVSLWDQNSSNDLTTSSTFGGDVNGTYSSLSLASDSIGTLELASSGVTAGTYGAGSSIPVLTVDGDGRVTLGINTGLAGGANITSVGTITSGTWAGSLFEVPYGGTSGSSFTANGILYGNGTGSLQQIGIGSSGQILTTNAIGNFVWSDPTGKFWGKNGNVTVSVDLVGTTNTSPLRIGTSNREVLRITADGKIGLGTTSPQEKFHIYNGSLLVDTPLLSLKGLYTTSPQLFFGVDVQGSLMYGVGFDIFGLTNLLSIVDISNPAAPVAIGNLSTSGAATFANIKVSGGYAYIAASGEGLLIVNVRNPKRPFIESYLNTPGSVVNLDVVGSYAYLADLSEGFSIVDIKDPKNPVLIGNYNSLGLTWNAKVVGEYAYLASGATGLEIVNIKNPYAPTLVSSVSTNIVEARGIQVSGKHAYIIDTNTPGGLSIINIANSTSPIIVGTVQSSLLGNFPYGIDISGHYAYIGAGNTFSAVDISNPAMPVVVNQLGLTSRELKIEGKYAYIASGQTALEIVDLSGGDVPGVQAENIASNEISSDTLFVGNNAFVSSGLNVGSGGILSNGVVSIVNTGITSHVSMASLNVIGGSSNGALVNIQTTSTSNYAIDVQTMGISRLFVSGNGNVGINTSDPSSFKLSVNTNLGPSTAPAVSTVTTSTTQLVTSDSDGIYTAITIGSDGLPVIAYRNATDTDIVITHCGDSTCTTGVSTTQIVDSNAIGQETDISIGQDGYPVIVTKSTTSNDLAVIKCDRVDCSVGTSTTVLSNTNNVGDYASVAIGADGLPIISYADTTLGDLVVTHCGDRSCVVGNSTTTIPDTDNVGGWTSIAVAPDGLPIITYANTTDTDLMITKCGNISCTSGNSTTQLVSALSIGNYSSIAIGKDGFPIIAFFDAASNDIRVLKCNDTNCVTNTNSQISTGDSDGTEISMSIGKDGFPVIAHYDTTATDLAITKCGNISCSSGNVTTVVSHADSIGHYSSITIPQDGIPLITNYNQTDTDLMITKCGDATCSQSTGYYYSGGYNLGSLVKYWNNVYADNIFAKDGIQVSNFDIAEDYETDADTESGDIISVDKTNQDKLVKAVADNKKNMVGVISTRPGLRLTDYANLRSGNKKPIALTGRVPVKISKSSADIHIGDFITLSDEPGKGKKAIGKDFMVGKSLENWTNKSGREKIEIFVNLEYSNQNPNNSFQILSETSEKDLPIVLENGAASDGIVTIDNMNISKSIKINGKIGTLGEVLSFQDGNVVIDTKGTIKSSAGINIGGKLSTSKLTVDILDPDNKVIGQDSVPKNSEKIFIKTKAVKNNAKILLTTLTPGIKVNIGEVLPGKGFEVIAIGNNTEGVGFNWVIFNTQNQ